MKSNLRVYEKRRPKITRLRVFVVITLAAVLSACGALKTELLAGIEKNRAGYGFLAFRFDSNWKYPNENEYLGRPFTFKFSAKGQIGDSIVFTKPDTLKIVELQPGEYTWVIGMIDQNAIFIDAVPFRVSAGKITNLGELFIEVPYDEKGRFGWRLSSIKQSGFSSVEEAVLERSTVQLPFDRQKAFPMSRSIRMRNSRGDEFDVKWESID